MNGVTNSSGTTYYNKFKNLNYIYWVPLNTVFELFNNWHIRKKKPVFYECRTLLDDIIITVQK